jgi:hypothetical protein
LAQARQDVVYNKRLADYWRDRCQVREISLATSTRRMTLEDIRKYPEPPEPPPPVKIPNDRDDDDDDRPRISRRRHARSGAGFDDEPDDAD